jgi:hypothetical protein
MPDLPLDVRRRNWGWFGDPWPSGICCTDDGRVMWEMQKPFPEGEACIHCGEVFRPGDNGTARPFLGTSISMILHIHKECAVAEVLGGIEHLQGHGHCPDGESDESLTRRQSALAVWDWVQVNSIA